MTSVSVNYQDWSMGASEPQTWRMAELTIAKSDSDYRESIDIYLSRDGYKKNTFHININMRDALTLLEQLKGLL